MDARKRIQSVGHSNLMVDALFDQTFMNDKLFDLCVKSFLYRHSIACCFFQLNVTMNLTTYQYLITFHLRQNKWNNRKSFHDSLQFDTFVYARSIRCRQRHTHIPQVCHHHYHLVIKIYRQTWLNEHGDTIWFTPGKNGKFTTVV